MNSKNIYNKITVKHLNKSISELYYAILLIVFLNVVIGLLVALIEDSLNKRTLTPFVLFFLPVGFYLFIAIRTKLNTLSYKVYLFTGVCYIFLCFIEFNKGYSLETFMSVYRKKGNNTHPMSYVMQLVPLLYKSFKVGLSLVFFKIAYLVYKYHKMHSLIK